MSAIYTHLPTIDSLDPTNEQHPSQLEFLKFIKYALIIVIFQVKEDILIS